MMKGYDPDRAVAFMLPRLQGARLSAAREPLLRAAIAADMAYMAAAGVIDAQGRATGAFYDDDAAFKAILAALKRSPYAQGAGAAAVEDFADQYMDLQEAFLTDEGLLGWE